MLEEPSLMVAVTSSFVTSAPMLESPVSYFRVHGIKAWAPVDKESEAAMRRHGERRMIHEDLAGRNDRVGHLTEEVSVLIRVECQTLRGISSID